MACFSFTLPELSHLTFALCHRAVSFALLVQEHLCDVAFLANRTVYLPFPFLQRARPLCALLDTCEDVYWDYVIHNDTGISVSGKRGPLLKWQSLWLT